VVSIKRVSELIREVEDGFLLLRPPFQRRLVWTSVVKDYFLETVRLGLPFPEIFIATGEIDTHSMKRKNWLVDGQQRTSTLREYVQGSKDLVLKHVKPYAELSQEEKTRFLDYEVVVRDLGTVSEEEIKKIFSRINSTDYALNTMEKLNALYSGAYRQFCDNLSRDAFFEQHSVFTIADRRRMRDLDFCVILVTTLLSTYYNRNEFNKEYLERYNDEFPEEGRIRDQIANTFEFVEQCGFDRKSRVWKKTDLFTLLVEIHSAHIVRSIPLTAALVGPRLQQFYSQVEELYAMTGGATNSDTPNTEAEVFRYLKAATKATNDKYARVDRAQIIAKILESTVPQSDEPVAKPKRKRRKSL
jgi:hypothetical protein